MTQNMFDCIIMSFKNGILISSIYFTKKRRQNECIFVTFFFSGHFHRRHFYHEYFFFFCTLRFSGHLIHGRISIIIIDRILPFIAAIRCALWYYYLYPRVHSRYMSEHRTKSDGRGEKKFRTSYTRILRVRNAYSHILFIYIYLYIYIYIDYRYIHICIFIFFHYIT